MFHVSRTPATPPTKLWSDGAERLEAAVADWYCTLESELPPGVNCNLSIWSNEYYLLAAVASFSVAGNSDAELVLEAGVHRNYPADQTATFRVEISRESGIALAAMDAPPLALDSSATISAAELSALIGELRAFLREHAPCVVGQLVEMEPVLLPAAGAVHSSDALVTRR